MSFVPPAAWPHRLRIVERVAGDVDEFGNPTLTEAEPVTVSGRVDSLSTSEDLGDRDQSTERFMVLMAPTLHDGRPVTDVLDHTAKIRWVDAYIDLEVDGPPARVDGAFGIHHFEVAAHRITG